jgi:hypothetical protein
MSRRLRPGGSVQILRVRVGVGFVLPVLNNTWTLPVMAAWLMVLVLFRLSCQFALDSRDFDACIDPESDISAKWTSTKSKAAA